MAPPRIQEIGRTYHANGKSVDGTKLFRDEADYLRFLLMLRKQTRMSDWCVLAYTLMPNHAHVIIRLRQLTLSSGFHRLNSVYARSFNKRHARRGALWQRRFFDAVVETDEHLDEAIRYVFLNAPKANLCDAPEDWPWSSYASAIGTRPADPIVDERELLALFGTRPDEARENIRAMVAERDPRNLRRLTRV